MATPLILMATHEQNTAQDQSTTNKAHLGSEEPKPETSKTRARKSGKGSNQKKQPQRGLGVAQLERLRMEERLKKMSEIAQQQQQQQPLNLLDQYNFQKVSDPLGSVQVQYGCGGPGPVVINSSYNGTGTGTGFYGFERGGGLAVQRIGNGGFGCGSSGSGFNVSGTRMNPILVDPNPYRIVGAPDQGEKVRANLYETSKELSSMPKMHTSAAVVSSDRCDVCCKKKRFNGESSIVVHVGKEKCSEELPMGGNNIFLGLNSESISPLAGETFGLGAGASLRSTGYYSERNIDHEGVEVLAIHRKGNLYAGSGGGVLMEYEFFPAGKEEYEYGGTFPKDTEILPLEASVPVNGSEASNHVDLSLKLSY